MLRMLPLVDMTYLARSGEAKSVVWCSSVSRTGIQRYRLAYAFDHTLRQLNTIDEQEKTAVRPSVS
jgi:putative hemolysin